MNEGFKAGVAHRVAIVGCEGSGKTVMLAGLGELYTHPDADGVFLAPQNFATERYVLQQMAEMRRGQWPQATDAPLGLDWQVRRRRERQRPETLFTLSCLDFAGEVYREAFGVRAGTPARARDVSALRDYIRAADSVVVLVNLRDIISLGAADERVAESVWLTNALLKFALEDGSRRAAIVLSQADSYEGILQTCGGAVGTLRTYLPHVANDFDWLDVFAVRTVDRTVVNADGEAVPARDFTLEGLRPLLAWLLAGPARRSAAEAEYVVIDLSGGPSAASYPVSRLEGVPPGGWTDEYKTTKLVLRRCPKGRDPRRRMSSLMPPKWGRYALT